MITSPAGTRFRVSTSDVPPRQRIDYWVTSSVRTIVGVSCNSFDESGLEACQTGIDLGAVRLLEVRSNAHVIQRSPRDIRRHRKDSLFACLLLEGTAFLYQGGNSVSLAPGDLAVYDADVAFMHGFSSSMRELTFDLHRPRFDGLPTQWTLKKLDGSTGIGRALSQSLTATALEALALPGDGDAARMEQRLRTHLGAVLDTLDPRLSLSEETVRTLLRIKSFIEDHLGDDRLNCEGISRAHGISVRQLHRLFEPTGSTVSEWIRECRLARCAADLREGSMRGTSIAAIGHRWAFADAAHFCRAFKARYGISPKEFRAIS